MHFEISLLETEAALLARCRRIEGLSFAQLASALGFPIPHTALKRKGWAGRAIELVLGATAGNQAIPDFSDLGVELKTVPMSHLGTPAESTFVTQISLLTLGEQQWETSSCYVKLQRVLWVPIEGDPTIDFRERRVGHAVLWSPSRVEASILKRDWTEFALMISTGQLSEIDAKMGEYLQVRPKAAHGRSLCYGIDEVGNSVLTLPRGFYLRSRFTKAILNSMKESGSIFSQ